MLLPVTAIAGKTTLWKSFNRWRTKRRTALSCGCLVAALTFFISLGATIYIPLRSIPMAGSQQPLHPLLFLGRCSHAAKINTYVHFMINTLSTLILISSNMFMQLLLAPTRDQIDKAHHDNRSLDIGIVSLRNLFIISKCNRVVWLCLAMTSLPLHLL
jgi:hypothetical protein